MNIVVGETYVSRVARQNGFKITVEVLFVGENLIVYRDKGVEFSVSATGFRLAFDEIPPWKPEVGKQAFFTGSTYVCGYGIVVAIEGNDVWFRYNNSNANRGIIVPIGSLSEKHS